MDLEVSYGHLKCQTKLTQYVSLESRVLDYLNVHRPYSLSGLLQEVEELFLWKSRNFQKLTFYIVQIMKLVSVILILDSYTNNYAQLISDWDRLPKFEELGKKIIHFLSLST